MNINTNSIRVIIGNNEIQHFFLCACEDCKGRGRRIDTAYSWHHANVIGWRFTRQEKYSPNGDLVALCPTCAKKYNLLE